MRWLLPIGIITFVALATVGVGTVLYRTYRPQVLAVMRPRQFLLITRESPKITKSNRSARRD